MRIAVRGDLSSSILAYWLSIVKPCGDSSHLSMRDRFWVVAQFGHADHTRVILKDFGRAQPLWLTRASAYETGDIQTEHYQILRKPGNLVS